MSITAARVSQITVTEVLDVNVPFADSSAAKKSITHDGLNTSQTLTGTTSPAATKHAAFQKALAAGVATIDLTALSGTLGVAVDGTGLKVRMVKFRNPATNGNPITIKYGAANPYLLFGAAWSIILAPGQEFCAYLADGAPAVAGGSKNIDLAGTLVQALDCEIVLG